MLLEEFDVDKYERTIKAEGREEGLRIGKEQGLAQGLERGLAQGLEQGLERGLAQGLERGLDIGAERAFTLTRKLMEQNRTEDLKRLSEDSEYREQLFREFEL